MMTQLFTIEDIKRVCKTSGQNWFEDPQIFWWSIRVHPQVWGTPEGAFFITSEQLVSEHCGNSSRRYTIRFCHNSGFIDIRSEFMEYTSLKDAIERVKLLVASNRKW